MQPMSANGSEDTEQQGQEKSFKETIEQAVQKMTDSSQSLTSIEQRQDIWNALPSDINRHLNMFKVEYTCCQTPAEQSQMQENWLSWRSDILAAVFRQSCWEAIRLWWKMPSRLQ